MMKYCGMVCYGYFELLGYSIWWCLASKVINFECMIGKNDLIMMKL